MLCKVLKPFPYAADHVTLRTLVEGEEVMIADDVFDGLAAEGFVEEADEAKALVEIPADYETRPWPELQAIGKGLGLPAKTNKTTTLAAIAAELARRATPPA